MELYKQSIVDKIYQNRIKPHLVAQCPILTQKSATHPPQSHMSLAESVVDLEENNKSSAHLKVFTSSIIFIIVNEYSNSSN